jgi:hypothetical protein
MQLKHLILLTTLVVFLANNSSAIICNPNLPNGCPEQVIISSGGGGNSTGINQSQADALYWRLDGTNAILISSDWDMGEFALNGIGGAYPSGSGDYSLGNPSNYWNNIYALTFSGISGNQVDLDNIYNLFSLDCPTGQVVNGTYPNGTFICTTVSSGGDGTGGWTNTSTETNTTLNVGTTKELLFRNSVSNSTGRGIRFVNVTNINIGGIEFVSTAGSGFDSMKIMLSANETINYAGLTANGIFTVAGGNAGYNQIIQRPSAGGFTAETASYYVQTGGGSITKIGTQGVFGDLTTGSSSGSSRYIYMSANGSATYNDKAFVKIDILDRLGLGFSYTLRPSYNLHVNGTGNI